MNPLARIPPTIAIDGLRLDPPQWCCLDGGSIVIHVMTADAASKYDLEEPWRIAEEEGRKRRRMEFYR